MTMTLLPDTERLVVAFLLSTDLASELPDGTPVDVRAIIGQRIYTTRPNRPDYPCAVVHRWGGGPALTVPLDRDEGWLQLDVWGGSKNDARVVCSALRQAMAERLIGAWPEGVVCNVKASTDWYMPDETFDPPRPRWLAQVMVATRNRKVA
jgi:hypothetical protein